MGEANEKIWNEYYQTVHDLQGEQLLRASKHSLGFNATTLNGVKAEFDARMGIVHPTTPPMIDRRCRNYSWMLTPSEDGTFNLEQSSLAVAMDTRDNLQSIARELAQTNYHLEQIWRAMQPQLKSPWILRAKFWFIKNYHALRCPC